MTRETRAKYDPVAQSTVAQLVAQVVHEQQGPLDMVALHDCQVVPLKPPAVLPASPGPPPGPGQALQAPPLPGVLGHIINQGVKNHQPALGRYQPTTAACQAPAHDGHEGALKSKRACPTPEQLPQLLPCPAAAGANRPMPHVAEWPVLGPLAFVNAAVRSSPPQLKTEQPAEGNVEEDLQSKVKRLLGMFSNCDINEAIAEDVLISAGQDVERAAAHIRDVFVHNSTGDPPAQGTPNTPAPAALQPSPHSPLCVDLTVDTPGPARTAPSTKRSDAAAAGLSDAAQADVERLLGLVPDACIQEMIENERALTEQELADARLAEELHRQEMAQASSAPAPAPAPAQPLVPAAAPILPPALAHLVTPLAAVAAPPQPQQQHPQPKPQPQQQQQDGQEEDDSHLLLLASPAEQLQHLTAGSSQAHLAGLQDQPLLGGRPSGGSVVLSSGSASGFATPGHSQGQYHPHGHYSPCALLDSAASAGAGAAGAESNPFEFMTDADFEAALAAECQFYDGTGQDATVGGYKVREEDVALLRFQYPDAPMEELQAALEAFQGDTMAVSAMLAEQQEEAVRTRLRQMEEDAEFARMLQQQEGQDKDVASQQVAEALATGLGPQVLEGAGPSRPRANRLLNSARALDALEAQQHLRGSAAAPRPARPAAQPSAGPASGDSAGGVAWEDVESERQARKLGLLQRLFGQGADQGLLVDVLSNCGGDVEAARQQLVSLGLQQVAEQPPPARAPIQLMPQPVLAQATAAGPSIPAAGPPLPAPATAGGASNWLARQMVPPTAGQKLTRANLARMMAGAGGAASFGAARGVGAPGSSGVGSARGAGGMGAGGSSDADARSEASMESAEEDAAYEQMLQHMAVNHGSMSRQDITDATQTMYKWLRAKPDRLRTERQALREEARAAWESGDKARASELARRVAALAPRIQRAEELACQRMHDYRNASNCMHVRCDLHGLHLREAMKVLDDYLQLLQRFPGYRVLEIVTGRGLHSEGEPVLLAATKSFLEERGLAFQEMVGALQVAMAPTVRRAPAGKGIMGSVQAGQQQQRRSVDGANGLVQAMA